jgi:hypothetical protein
MRRPREKIKKGCHACQSVKFASLHRIADSVWALPCWQLAPILSLQGLPQTVRAIDGDAGDLVMMVPRPFLSSALRRLALGRPVRLCIGVD